MKIEEINEINDALGRLKDFMKNNSSTPGKYTEKLPDNVKNDINIILKHTSQHRDNIRKIYDAAQNINSAVYFNNKNQFSSGISSLDTQLSALMEAENVEPINNISRLKDLLINLEKNTTISKEQIEKIVSLGNSLSNKKIESGVKVIKLFFEINQIKDLKKQINPIIKLLEEYKNELSNPKSQSVTPRQSSQE